MTLQQLRFFCEIVDRGLNISSAANALHTSQPGVSKQMKLLEQEFGTALFVRSRKRIVSLTNAGKTVLRYARLSIDAADNICRVGMDFASPDVGDFTIATTHTYARYVLPDTVEKFIRHYPKVRLSLRQGNPTQIAEWISSGELDLGISGYPLGPFSRLLRLPCYEYDRVVLAKEGHPFLREKRITLETIAKYPMITYDSSFTGRAQIATTFADKGLSPHIALSAIDTDVMKAYVKLGLGIAIVSEIVYNAAEDRGLRVVNIRNILKPNVVCVIIRKGVYLRSYAYNFIELFCPKLGRRVVELALADDAG